MKGTQLLILLGFYHLTSPFMRHRYRWFPLIFILVGAFMLMLLLSILIQFGSSQMVLVELAQKSPTKKNALVSASFDLEAFLLANVSMMSVTATALLCFVVWCYIKLSAAARGCLVPLLENLKVVEDEVWAHEEDMRSRVSQEQHRQ